MITTTNIGLGENCETNADQVSKRTRSHSHKSVVRPFPARWNTSIPTSVSESSRQQGSSTVKSHLLRRTTSTNMSEADHTTCADQPNSSAVAVPSSASQAAAVAPAEAAEAAVDQPKLSKKQMKKKRRFEKAMERKRRRKEQEREQKRARALAAGRDLDEERRIQKQNEASGEGHRRREERWLAKMEDAKKRFKVAIDCAFESDMTPKEINSLAQQIRYCYAANKKSANPVFLSIPDLSGETLHHLNNVCGFPDQWQTRSFSFSGKSLVDMHAEERSSLVYLTSDSDNTLEHLEDDKIYVIGGIVDRNRLKNATLNRAEELRIQTARLPISQHLQMFSTNVLTTNHVFEILLKYRERGNDWKQGMLDVLPKRKDYKEIGDDGHGSKSEDKDNDDKDDQKEDGK